MPTPGDFFQEILGHAAGRVAQGMRLNDPISKYYGKVLTRFSNLLMGRWAAASGAGIRCNIPVERPGRPACGGFAAGSCLVCAQPACLDHAHATVRDGSIICHRCVARAKLEHGEVFQDTPGWPPPGEETNGSDNTKRHCLGVMGLPMTASIHDVKARFKELARKYHPDRARTDAQRRAHEKRFKKISAAFSWLEKHMGEQAA